ncbi:selenide, water dikinase SelD [Persicimonas caeni]|uniref:Selenide, water dikinase SelD n=1 Tax=Persicimonas caeni TaxID=2292766 RepID=A0A4Y6PZE4_PERCE|nr:selenide, water dikinase SelD [Persicimonas caeni]QDG53698.1 selenide, water dikinase SelD [Persicimonas caeni]QED34919.1 selenide, water dikinase SelD [Persicimonas caeni]
MKSTAPIIKDLVLVGGGHSHVAVLKMLGMRPVEGLRVTLVTRDVHTPYSGMLPGLIAGQYSLDEAHIDLRPLCEFAGARLYHDTVTGMDLDAKQLACKNRPPVSYDFVSFDIGSTPQTHNVPGAAEHSTPVKPVDQFLERLAELTRTIESNPGDSLRVAVVGAGAGGVELVLALEHRLRTILRAQSTPETTLECTLFSASSDIMPTHNPRVRKKLSRILDERGIAVRRDCRVQRVEPDGVIDTAGTHHPFDAVMWVTNASAPGWIAQAGLATDEAGFIAVDDHLQSTSHPGVFAAGDIASMSNHDLAKSGVYAVRQGMPLAENLRRIAQGRPLKAYRPQKNFLSLIGTGDGYAVGSKSLLAFEGDWVWKLKDWIDRRWMEQWDELPEMEDDEATDVDVQIDSPTTREALSAMAMRCGGCGSKLGHTVLSRVLQRLDVVERDDVIIGLDAPDDSAVTRVPDGMAVVQTVDFFRTFIDDPYTFGRIAANHSLGDIWAMGAEPQSALAVAVVPYGVEDKIEQDLYQLLAGAVDVLRDSGAALVGGHSGEGAEMSFGLQVNGLVDPDDILRKGGMQPGDALVLTKPIGTGTLFAANMRQEAKGRWIDAALDTMAQSSREAARCMREHGATACTDITGFGLLGHLVEMTRPSGVDATLDLDKIPLLDGALETTAAGIFSSLQPDNIRLRRALQNMDEAADHPVYPLLFDPQTAGGLLASIPAERAADCVSALRRGSYAHAAIIGHIAPRTDAPAPIRLIL